MESRESANNDRGQVGIGTLIVFIAMVLVAAIAAGVLVHTAGFLQTQAEETGTQSTQQVADAVNIITETGEVGTDDEIHELRVGVQPAAGASEINLAALTIQYSGGGDFGNLVVDDVNGERASGDADPSDVDAGVGSSAEDYRFGVEVVSAENEDDLVMTDNADRYELVINTSGADENGLSNLGPVEEGDRIELTITTEVGSQVVAFLRVPDSLSDVDEGDTISL